MKQYILRLDDACEKRNIENWNRMEEILDKYEIKPLVGIIPNCQDCAMDRYDFDYVFWDRVKKWRDKQWIIAMHGYNHVYSTLSGGINPINNRSEFAGELLKVQKAKVAKGIEIFDQHNIRPRVFFAPSHTFDSHTLVALKEKSDIRFISDTIANKPYLLEGITFVPQQSGSVRKLPFSLTTFCYHPNSMQEFDFQRLEKFIRENQKRFISFPLTMATRKLGAWDKILKWLYFLRRHR